MSANWKRGFWRLAFAFWILFSATLVWILNPSAPHPLRRIDPSGLEEPVLLPESRDFEADKRSVAAGGEPDPFTEIVCDGVKNDPVKYCDREAWSKAHAAWEGRLRIAVGTATYWTAAGTAAIGVAAFSAVFWGVFYSIVWIARGFAKEERHEE